MNLGDVNGTELLMKNCFQNINEIQHFEPINLAAEIGIIHFFSIKKE